MAILGKNRPFRVATWQSCGLSQTGQGTGESGQTTTRVLTSTDKAAGTSSRTTVTRTDTGEGKTNTDGTVKTEDGQTERTGTFGGNSDNVATVIYDYRASSALSGQPKFYEKANGTITTDVNTTFNGTSNSTNTDSFETLHADAIRKSTEDSTYETGWSEGSAWSFLLGSGEWAGEKFTQTVKGHGSEKIQSDVESGELIITGDPNGSVGYTDTVTIVSWNYDVDDADNYSKFDRTWTSALTNNAGVDENGHPTHSQSLVQTWDMKDLTQSKTFEDLSQGVTIETLDTTTLDIVTDTGQSTQTSSLSGPANARRSTLHITSGGVYTDLVITDQHRFWEGSESVAITDKKTTTGDTVITNSSYTAGHLVGPEGEAIGGRFTTGGTRVKESGDEVDTKIHLFGEDHGGEFDDHLHTNDHLYSTTTLSSSESGAYYDVSSPGGGLARVQAGQYVILNHDATYHDIVEDNTYDGVSYVVEDGAEIERDDTWTVREGNYDATSGREKSSRWRSYDKWFHEDVTWETGSYGSRSHAWFVLATGEEPEGRYTWSGYLNPGNDPPPIDQPWFGGAPPMLGSTTVELPPQPPGVVESAWLGFQYGVVKTAKALTFGLVDNDAAAEELARYTLTEEDRALADSAAARAANLGHTALAGPLIGRGVAALTGSRVGAWLAGSPIGRFLARPAVQVGVGAGSQAHNAVDAAKDASQAAASFYGGDLAGGLGHTLDLLDNLPTSLRTGGGHAKPKAVAPKSPGQHCFVAGTEVIVPAIATSLAAEDILISRDDAAENSRADWIIAACGVALAGGYYGVVRKRRRRATPREAAFAQFEWFGFLDVDDEETDEFDEFIASIAERRLVGSHD